MMRGTVLRYLGWQVRDRTLPRLLVGWLIVAAIMLPIHFAMRDNPPNPDQVPILAQSLFEQLAFITAVVLFHGIVADDRVKGYYRFYLAKPVSPLWFYGQSFVLALAAMLLFTLGFIGFFALAIAPQWVWGLLVSGAAMGLLVGALMFALSTVTARDWIWMIVVLVVITVLRSRFPAGESAWGDVLNAILPPNQLIDETSLSLKQWAWVVSWAAGLFSLGLIVLRVRPLGED